MIGIYKITHKKTFFCYIGQSVNIYSRWKQHMNMNESLISIIIGTCGKEQFDFEVLEQLYVDISQSILLLDAKERYYFNLYKNEAVYNRTFLHFRKEHEEIIENYDRQLNEIKKKYIEKKAIVLEHQKYIKDIENKSAELIDTKKLKEIMDFNLETINEYIGYEKNG